MKCAIMQPYMFPYIGYYQLVNSVDKFVFYDDVNFIKSGYINRNNILVSGAPKMFTIPVVSASRNKLISELSYSTDVRKTLNTIKQAYSKARYFTDIFPMIEKVLLSEYRDITFMARMSIELVFEYLEIEKQIYLSSQLKNDKSLSAKERIIEMTKMLNCDVYINSPGGKNLYDKEFFALNGIELGFIDSLNISYDQGTPNFVPNLSIIDILMRCSKQEINKLINQFEIS